jgi:hypothetical protein
VSNRSELEDRYTVYCYGCNTSRIDPNKKPNQKYAPKCSMCKRTNMWNRRFASKRNKTLVKVPNSFPVRPLNPGQDARVYCICGTCHLTWDDAIATQYTPTHGPRCPFEAFH